MKAFIPALALSGLLFCSTPYAASGPVNQPAAAAQSTSYLFVIRAPQAKLVPVSGKSFQLLIPVKDLSSVLAFSDRPDRIVKQLTLSEYVKLVHTGSNSFAVTPPSVALTIGDNPTHIFELMGAKKVGDNIVYSLILLNNQTAPGVESGPLSLYVDDIVINPGNFPLPG